jgi:hypothetical protein
VDVNIVACTPNKLSGVNEGKGEFLITFCIRLDDGKKY